MISFHSPADLSPSLGPLRLLAPDLHIDVVGVIGAKRARVAAAWLVAVRDSAAAADGAEEVASRLVGGVIVRDAPELVSPGLDQNSAIVLADPAGVEAKAWGTALVLVILVLSTNMLAILVRNYYRKKISW